jgi:transcriptional regulator with XRE-family HTH domain
MEVTVTSVAELGEVVRAARRHGQVRLDDLAATAGVSKQFVSDVEYGKSTVRLGLVLKLLAELGIPLKLDIPQLAMAELAALRAKGGVLRPRSRPGRQVADPASPAGRPESPPPSGIRSSRRKAASD